MSSRSIRQRIASARIGLLALIVVFQLAQGLGWLHRALHGVPGGMPPAAATLLEPAGETVRGPSWIQALFGDHADASDCRLFDAIAQPGCVHAGALVPPALLASGFIASGDAGFLALYRALFDARGPPHAL